MKFNPWGLAVALVILLAAIPTTKDKKMLPRSFWVIFVIAVLLLVWNGYARAEEKNTHYCIQMENGYKTVTQCQNGTVTIVDNVSDKVVVCSTNPSENPRCQTVAFKDSK